MAPAAGGGVVIGWTEPVTEPPPLAWIEVVCDHGGAGRRHVVDRFRRLDAVERPTWAGDCGWLLPFASALGSELRARGAGEALALPERSRLFAAGAGELPRWRARCAACRRAPRDARRSRSVGWQVELPGARLVALLDSAAVAWVQRIDLFDLANHGGRGTAAAVAEARDRPSAQP